MFCSQCGLRASEDLFCSTCGSKLKGGYIEPETTDEYWFGVWDTLVDLADTPGGAWVLDSNSAKSCILNIPDQIRDELRDFGRDDLAKQADEVIEIWRKNNTD